MQLDTLVKLGALALEVAQDDKVRELATLIHRGAKRRGIIPASPIIPAPPAAGSGAASGASAAAAKAKPAATPAVKPAPAAPWVPFGPTGLPVHMYGGSGISKYLTADNAKKALALAGVFKGVLGK